MSTTPTTVRRHGAVVAAMLLLAGIFALTGTAQGAYPGENGKIAFEDGVPRHIFVADADGSIAPTWDWAPTRPGRPTAPRSPSTPTAKTSGW